MRHKPSKKTFAATYREEIEAITRSCGRNETMLSIDAGYS